MTGLAATRTRLAEEFAAELRACTSMAAHREVVQRLLTCGVPGVLMTVVADPDDPCPVRLQALVAATRHRLDPTCCAPTRHLPARHARPRRSL